ncbi:MAG: hypothetical protein KDE27_27355 [Planctomycetes bacterium]|nr:hypothetical protein [Planctomycetota bacterium]
MRTLATLLSISAWYAVAPAQSGTLTQLPSANTPAVHGFTLAPTMAHDAATGRLVLANGLLFGSGFETWEYDGTGWTLVSTLTMQGSGAVSGSNLVWDDVRQSCLLVTSTGYSLYLSEWRQGSWQPLASAPLVAPEPNGVRLVLARDPLQNRSVIIAGSPAHTYLFDGTQITAAGSAPWATGAAFDPVRGQPIAVEGLRTYAFDGVAWNLTPNQSSDQLFELVTDPVLPRVLAIATTGLFEWNGGRWRKAVTPSGARPEGNAIALDPQTGDVFLVRLSSNSMPGSTWLYRELPPVGGWFAFHGAGCAGPLGAPSWVPPGDPPRFARELLCMLRNVPTGPQNATFALFGSDATTWNGQSLPLSLAVFGAPGCSAWLAPLFALPMHGGNNLVATTIFMPASVAVVGQRFYLQATTLVPGWNALGAIFSDAAVGRIGTR